MLRCGDEIRLTQAEQRRLRLLTRTNPKQIKSAAALSRLIGFHVWRYAGDSPEEKLLRAMLNQFNTPA